MTKEEEIYELEQAIVEAEQIVKLADQLQELKNNEAFKAVIIDGYIKHRADYLFEQLTKPVTMQSISEEELKDGLLSIRYLKSYLGFDGFKGTVELDGEAAKADIAYCEERLHTI